jgi:uncharacterized protein (TIGR00375 family)
VKYIADLHLHSKYSRAVSSQMVVPEMARWGKIKGIDILGTGDFTHPLWFTELRSGLEEVGEGIFGVKDSILTDEEKAAVAFGEHFPNFVLSTEIASIYTQGGKPRRIHNLVLAPSFETVEKINAELKRRGANLMSDGRPIVGLSSREVCEIVFSIDRNALVFGAHVWTPWFSLYGSKSGFDSLEECYGEFSKEIFAAETGLSSDPAMNWRVKDLDTRAILSFSDAHSPAKLGREATVFEIPNGKLSYPIIAQAIRMGSGITEGTEAKIAYTIEFYPEEGKYHYTGHRSCKVRQSPEETAKKGTTCPVCGRPLTVGVMHRVQELADREVAVKKERLEGEEFEGIVDGEKKRLPYVMLVPLQEILAESMKTSFTSLNVINEYKKMTKILGSEYKVLLQTKPEDITRVSGERTAEGIMKVRAGEILVEPGYDGVFGQVKIWGFEERKEGEVREKKRPEEQMTLF